MGAFAKEAAQKAIVHKTVADLEWEGFVAPTHFHTRGAHSVVIAGKWAPGSRAGRRS